MDSQLRYDNYPAWVVIISNLNQALLYGIGSIVLYRLGLIFFLLYLAYILVLEFRLIKDHCADCYYWGKTCGFGRGRLSAVFFKKGETSRFCVKSMTWKDLASDMMVSLIPLVAGIVLMLIKFDLLLLVSVIMIFLLTTMGNAFVRGSLACRYCRQRDLGCPAEKLFNKRDK